MRERAAIKSSNIVACLAYSYHSLVNLQKEARIKGDESYMRHIVHVRHQSKSRKCVSMMAIKAFYRSQMLPFPHDLSAPKRNRPNPTYLNEKEVANLLKQSSSNLREHAIISILVYTGVRVGELCNLDIENCDIKRNILRIRHGKGDKDRGVVISPACAKAIEDYMNQRTALNASTDALFLSIKGHCRLDPSTIQRAISKFAKEVGIKKNVTPHVLRHTFATSVFRRGGSLRFIQEMLGHSSLSTTQIYMHLDEDTRLDMYDKHGPIYP